MPSDIGDECVRLGRHVCGPDAQAAEGALILHRLVPAPDHGPGFRRDPETGFVYYSSEWLSDEREGDDDA